MSRVAEFPIEDVDRSVVLLNFALQRRARRRTADIAQRADRGLLYFHVIIIGKLGKVRALATTGKVRSSVLPNVPTMSEAGVPGYEAVIWLGVMAPKGTPPEIVRRLNAEITAIVGRPEVRDDWARQGAVAMARPHHDVDVLGVA